MTKRVAVLAVLVSLVAHAQPVSDLDPHPVATPVDGGVLISWQARVGAPATVTVRRRDAGMTNFGLLASGLDAGTVSWFVPGPLATPAEFHVQRGTGNGWVMAGAEVPFRDDQGVVLVVVAASQATTRLDQWEQDLRDDGWAVQREVLTGSEGPPQVKARIWAAYLSLGSRLRAVFLLGRVPRAFSGNIAPDGHTDHRGAWPADLYYADLDGGAWTDSFFAAGSVGQFVNDAGDGKFDQSSAPSNPEVQVGRVDFEAMPAFGPDAGLALLERYLDKAHDFRIGQTQVAARTLVDDSFGFFGGEAFSRVAYRDGTAITGQPTDGLDFFTTLNASDAGYLLAFGCGAGTPTGAGGVGTTTDFVNGAPNAVFVGLFGSYFGDWNYPNNFLRAALASRGRALASMWFARPYANLHSLGALESFGDAFNRGIVGQSTFVYDSSGRGVHQALLGDPTLRLFYPPRLTGLTAVVEGQGVRATWTAAPATNLVGHHVYRRLAGSTAAEVRVTAAPTLLTTLLDGTAPSGQTLEYRAVAVVRQTTGSGTFWNHSLGMRAQVTTPMFVDAGMMGDDAGVDAGVTADAGAEPDAGTQADAGTTVDAGMISGDGGLPLPLPLEPRACGCSAATAGPLFALLALAGVLRRRRAR